MDGFIRIDRGIRGNKIWNTPWKLRAWLDLLLAAAFKDVQYNGETIRRGSLPPTSYRFLSERWGVSKDKAYRFVQELQRDGRVRVKTERKTERQMQRKTNENRTPETYITICNYDKYQKVDSESERKANDNQTTSETPGETKKKKYIEEEVYKEGHARAREEKPQKRLATKHVNISDEDYADFKDRWGQKRTDEKISNLDIAISRGKVKLQDDEKYEDIIWRWLIEDYGEEPPSNLKVFTYCPNPKCQNHTQGIHKQDYEQYDGKCPLCRTEI